MNYLRRKANPWVSLAVLAGGVLSAVILFWITKIETEIHLTSF